MSLPDTASIENLTGKYTLNKTKSSGLDKVLELQGLSWFKRTAASFAPIVVNITQTTQQVDDTTVDFISVKSTINGKEMASEERYLDFKPREVEIPDFGTLRVRSEWLTDLSAIESEFLRAGWNDGGKYVHIVTESLVLGWTLEHVWGVQEGEGERRYVRQVRITKGAEERTAKLVYDWVE